MINLLKIKFTFLAIVVGVALSSCGSSNDVVSGGMFSKRKYTNGYHSNFRKNTQTEESYSLSESLKESEDPKNEIRKNKFENREIVSELKEAIISKEEEEFGIGEIRANSTKKEISDTPNFYNERRSASKISLIKEREKKSNFKTFKKESKKMMPNPRKKNGLLNVLFIILLIVVIIALLSLIEGIIGTIISVLLLLLIVYLVLHLFGVI